MESLPLSSGSQHKMLNNISQNSSNHIGYSALNWNLVIYP